MEEVQDQTPKRKIKRYATVTGIVLAAYVLSFGPLYACLYRLCPPDPVFKVVFYAYYPHWRLCYHSEIYYKYMCVWSKLGKEPTWGHDEFRYAWNHDGQLGPPCEP